MMDGEIVGRFYRGMDIKDRDGFRVGTVEEVYLDNETRWPTVARVTALSFRALVPLDGVKQVDGKLQVPFTIDVIKSAPLSAHTGDLSTTLERQLYRHYGLQDDTRLRVPVSASIREANRLLALQLRSANALKDENRRLTDELKAVNAQKTENRILTRQLQGEMSLREENRRLIGRLRTADSSVMAAEVEMKAATRRADEATQEAEQTQLLLIAARERSKELQAQIHRNAGTNPATSRIQELLHTTSGWGVLATFLALTLALVIAAATLYYDIGARDLDEAREQVRSLERQLEEAVDSP